MDREKREHVLLLTCLLSTALCASCGSISPAEMEYVKGLRAEKGEEGNTNPLECYNKAIRLDPNQASYYRTRAGYYNGKGDIVLAVQDIDRAIALAPQWDYLHYERGLYHCKLMDFKQAETDFDTAIKNSPGNKQFYSGLALANLCLGKNEEALKSIDLALATDHPMAQWKYQRGIILAKAGKRSEAVDQFAKTAAFTRVSKDNSYKDVYFDGEREYNITSQLSIQELSNSWTKPVSIDYYR
jgi:tetratricopeptide (TPR) repeat protein